MNATAITAIADHLATLAATQVTRLALEKLTKAELIAALAPKLTVDEAKAIEPAMQVIKAEVYRRLSVTTTKEVKALGLLEGKRDFRRKATWLELLALLKVPVNTAANDRLRHNPEMVEESDHHLDGLTVRQLRDKAKDVRLPGWGKLVKLGGAEALRAALKQYLA